jgi:hypothetical protein
MAKNGPVSFLKICPADLIEKAISPTGSNPASASTLETLSCPDGTSPFFAASTV